MTVYRTDTWRDWVILFVEFGHDQAPPIGCFNLDWNRKIIFFREEEKDVVKKRLSNLR